MPTLQSERLRWLATVIFAELALLASLVSLGWNHTITLLVASVLVTILTLCAWWMQRVIQRWSQNRFQFGVRQFIVACSILCLIVAAVARYYGRTNLDRYGVTRLRSAGVEPFSRSEEQSVHPELLRDADVIGIAVETDAAVSVVLHEFWRFPNLSELILAGRISNDGLARLTSKPLPQDIAINLWGQFLTDDCIRHLRDCSSVSVIAVNGSPISSTGVKQIASIQHVTRVCLLQEFVQTQTRVNDSAVRSLAGMHQLLGLTLRGPDVTDKSVETLGQLSNLEALTLIDTSVTDAGEAELRSLLPTCKITRR